MATDKLVDFDHVKKLPSACTVELPVKLGQKVYTIPRSAIREWTVVGVWLSVKEECSYVHIYWEKNGHHMESRAVNFCDLDRTVFLTKEEAEAETNSEQNMPSEPTEASGSPLSGESAQDSAPASNDAPSASEDASGGFLDKWLSQKED